MRKRRRDDTKKQNKKEEFYKLKTNKKAFSNDFVTLQNGKGKLQKLNRLYLGKILLGAVIAQWIRLCLPTCGLGFNRKHAIYAYSIVKFKTIFVIVLTNRCK